MWLLKKFISNIKCSVMNKERIFSLFISKYITIIINRHFFIQLFKVQAFIK